MSWTDEEIDKLFQKEAVKQPVEYKDAYWKEFEAMLPVTRKGDFLWFLTSGIFVALLLVTPFVGVLNSERSAEVMAMENGQNSAPEANEFVVGNENEKNQNDTESSEAFNEELYNNTEEVENNVNTHVSNESSSANELTEANRSNEANESNDSYRLSRANETSTEIIEALPVAAGTVIAAEVAEDVEVVETAERSEYIAVVETNMTENSVEQLTSENENETIQEDVNGLSIAAVKPVDQNNLSNELNSITYDLKMPVRTSLYVEANAGLSQSLITPSDDISHSFGIGVGTQFRKGKIVFTTGVNAIWAHHKDIHLNRQAKVYGFGSTVVQSHLNYSELYTLEANLNVGYQLGRHNINLGVRPSFVVGSKVKFTQSDFSTDDNRTVYGFMDGINRWGVKPSLGYAFDLSSNLTLGVNLSTQLLESVNEDFINGVNNKLPFDGQIYLRKTIRLRK